MNKFRINDVFFLKSMNILFVMGEITDGKIKAGMKFNVRDKEFVVDRFEFVDGKNDDGIPFTHIALGISPNDKVFFDCLLADKINIEIELQEP